MSRSRAGTRWTLCRFNANRFSSTIEGNKEMNQLWITSQVSNIIIDNFVGHKNWIDTCDDRIQLYWECTNYTLPSIELESIWV